VTKTVFEKYVTNTVPWKLQKYIHLVVWGLLFWRLVELLFWERTCFLCVSLSLSLFSNQSQFFALALLEKIENQQNISFSIQPNNMYNSEFKDYGVIITA
jgi:hypothetical protein